MEHRAVDLKNRTKSFALRIIRLVRALPPGSESRIMGGQLLRAATSMAANYRAVYRARSRAEFLAKLSVVLEEADEAAFWMELITESGLVSEQKASLLKSEANQLVAIFNASRTTARRGFHSKINNQKSTIFGKAS